MTVRSRVAREEEPHGDGGRPSARSREPRAHLPDREAAADARLVGRLPEAQLQRLVGRLPEAQLQRLAGTLQGTLGNRGAGVVLRGIQRAPAAAEPEAAGQSGLKTIQTLTARLVEKPSFIARTVAALSRGDVVTLTGERKGGWHRVVTADGDTGWLHQSAWQTSTPKLSSAPGAGGSGPPEEIEIGGRG